MAFPAALLLQAIVVLVLAAALTCFLRRPRLALEVSLRGGTRAGKLYVVLTNRGGFAARNARLTVAWRRSDGSVSKAEARGIGTLGSHDPVRLEVTRLHELIEGDAAGWSELVVEARALNALPARAVVEVAARAQAERVEPVRYARASAVRCPDSPDGTHLFATQPFVNDGVTETWHVCRRCRHLEREPLSPEDQERQRRARRERLERERRRIEEEFARAEREEDPAPRARPGQKTWKRFREEEEEKLARDVDTFPPELAFFVLELDPAKATWDDVVAAHRRLALAHHPDRQPGIDGETRFALERKMQEINGARDRLREHFGLRPAMD